MKYIMEEVYELVTVEYLRKQQKPAFSDNNKI